MAFLRSYWLCLLLALFCGSTNGQSNRFRQIEQQVYQYNNALQYKKSQALLLPILNQGSYSADDQFQAAILLSYTYKRVQDYATTLQFLDKAEQLAPKTKVPAAAKAQVLTQQAFAFFDIRDYARADRLMRGLEQTQFRYINQENKAKLVHQQGYLLALAKQYPAAEATYDRALRDLRAASPCDLPMILVKKMQLYAAMNRMDLALHAFGQANQSADSCGIIKYQIYANEELSRIYKERKDATGFAAAMQRLNALNLIYARGENIATLHNQKEAIAQQTAARQLQEQLRRQEWLLGSITLLGLAVLLLIGWWLYRRQQQRLEREKAQIQAQLERQITDRQQQVAKPMPIAVEFVANLSDRQRQVLTYLVQGLSNRDIAELMYVSENTVKYHVKNIYDELGVKNRKELLTRLRDV